MDKIILFDWGGIVENHENNMKELQDAKIRLIKSFNPSLSDEEILDRFTYKTKDGRNMNAVGDDKSIHEWVDFIQKRCNINVDYETFKNKYEEEFGKIKYYKDVVDYVHSLKDRCKIGILSNLCFFDYKRIDKQYDLSKFDYVYLSYELRVKKPDKKIYEYVIDDLKVEPKNILFFDDREDNVHMANKCGINAYKVFGFELDKIKNIVDEFLK